MSKSKLIHCSESVLGFQSTYKTVECALWHKENLSIQTIAKEKASSLLIPTIDLLLSHHDLSFEEIACIIVNQGPGPFTTLRTVIATANGINMGSGVPLISVNGLEAFLTEFSNTESLPTIALLNAFHETVYYGIQENNSPSIIGHAHIDNLLALLQQRYPSNVMQFLGNGTEMYRDKIIAFFQNQAYIPNPIPQTCSLEQIMSLGCKQWEQKIGLVDQVTPLYLKKPVN